MEEHDRNGVSMWCGVRLKDTYNRLGLSQQRPTTETHANSTQYQSTNSANYVVIRYMGLRDEDIGMDQ